MPWGGVKEKRRAPVSKRGREGIRYRGGAGSPLKNCSVQNLRPERDRVKTFLHWPVLVIAGHADATPYKRTWL